MDSQTLNVHPPGKVVEVPASSSSDEDEDSVEELEEVEPETSGVESESTSASMTGSDDCVDYTRTAQTRSANLEFLTKSLSKQWMREKGGGRYTEMGYEDVIRGLRNL